MPFVVIDKLDSQEAVHKYWRDVATRISKREPRMPITKSLSDVAWAAVTAAAQALVDAKTFRTTSEAIDAMKRASHPAYLTYLASLSGTTPPVNAPNDVVKRAEAQDVNLEKRRQVTTELQKRASALVRRGEANSETEAVAKVFHADRAFYNEYRANTYSSGPLPAAVEKRAEGPIGPVQVEVTRLAKALKDDDPWGRFKASSQPEMVLEVFKQHPELYWAYRLEVLR